MEKLKQFADLGLSEKTLDVLEKKGFEEPTDIQRKAIPLLLEDRVDVVGQAQTGTGKTAAFGLPILENIETTGKAPKALVLVPTRELALQVAEEISSLKADRGIRVASIYGGQSIVLQFKRLESGVDIVVGTPGRILDHLRRKKLDLSHLSNLVLDEADEMLNMGFLEDIETIIQEANPERRILLFSATMPERIVDIAKRHMGDYKTIRIKSKQLASDLTKQIYYEVAESDKFEALCRIIDIEPDFYGLVFCRTKRDVDNISAKLLDRGYDAEGLHGEISQFLRERILDKFKKRHLTVLVATDVASRGIDVENMSHVINYAIPYDSESYVHRIGRTGRAGKSGTAITFVTSSEYRKLKYIQRTAKAEIAKCKIPDVKDIIKSKRERFNTELGDILCAAPQDNYSNWAKELLDEHGPHDLVAALLKRNFQDELDESNYAHIRDRSVELKGKARLFVAMGRKDGMTPKKLVMFISQKTKVHEWKIRNTQVEDVFSFISVPLREAEIIIEFFKKRGRNDNPMVEHAKEPKKGPSGSGDRDDKPQRSERRGGDPSRDSGEPRRSKRRVDDSSSQEGAERRTSQRRGEDSSQESGEPRKSKRRAGDSPRVSDFFPKSKRRKDDGSRGGGSRAGSGKGKFKKSKTSGASPQKYPKKKKFDKGPKKDSPDNSPPIDQT